MFCDNCFDYFFCPKFPLVFGGAIEKHLKWSVRMFCDNCFDYFFCPKFPLVFGGAIEKHFFPREEKIKISRGRKNKAYKVTEKIF